MEKTVFRIDDKARTIVENIDAVTRLFAEGMWC